MSEALELAREEIDEVLRAGLVGRIGCHDDGATYVVPVIYAYDGEAFYVVSGEGRKLAMMRANPRVCFEVDEVVERAPRWRSVVAEGRFEELHGLAAARALALLVRRFASRTGRAGAPRRKRGGSTVAFRIVVESVTGREVPR